METAQIIGIILLVIFCIIVIMIILFKAQREAKVDLLKSLYEEKSIDAQTYFRHLNNL